MKPEPNDTFVIVEHRSLEVFEEADLIVAASLADKLVAEGGVVTVKYNNNKVVFTPNWILELGEPK